ncbi:MAG: helix-turn-helix transcriptional regulator [Beijerinckiaceae bacterium]
MNRTLHLSRPGREPASESSDSGEPRPIGGEIRGLRNARRLTLTDLADASGLSIGYLSLLERDRATPSIKALHAVSRALGVIRGMPSSSLGDAGSSLKRRPCRRGFAHHAVRGARSERGFSEGRLLRRGCQGI